jgi:hypothetical protein
MEMTEKEHSRKLANIILDQSWRDPDDDLSVLARQLLRADEVIAAKDVELAKLREDRFALYQQHEIELGRIQASKISLEEEKIYLNKKCAAIAVESITNHARFDEAVATKDAEIAELKEAISETHEELWKCGGFIGDLANKGHPYAVAALRAQLAAAEASNKELREALEPFAKEAKYYDPDEQDGRIINDDLAFSNDGDDLNVGDLRRAREALGDKPK